MHAGQRFHRLTAIRRDKDQKWLFRCDCGNEKLIRTTSVSSGRTTSCGCYRDEVAGNQGRTHGHSVKDRQSPEYRTWSGMKQRCLNPKAKHYAYYGGRGITVHPAWVNDFAQFLRDMGPRPEGTTLDRKDPDGHYEPGNCHWATPQVQGTNRRNTHKVTQDGVEISLLQYAKTLNLSYAALYRRVSQGMTAEQAVADIRHPAPRPEKPSKPKSWRHANPDKIMVEHDGGQLTLRQFSELMNVPVAEMKYLTQFHGQSPLESAQEILAKRRKRP